MAGGFKLNIDFSNPLVLLGTGALATVVGLSLMGRVKWTGATYRSNYAGRAKSYVGANSLPPLDVSEVQGQPGYDASKGASTINFDDMNIDIRDFQEDKIFNVIHDFDLSPAADGYNPADPTILVSEISNKY